MGAFDQVRSNQILDAIHGVTPLVASTAPAHLRFMTANGSMTAAGTELATGGGYTAATGAPTVTVGAASAGSSANTAAVTVTNMPVATVVGVEEWDSNATPKRQAWGALTTAKSTNAGDTLSIPVGNFTLSLP